MIPSDHFVRFYNEVFKFLDRKGGLAEYYEEISRHQELHCLKLFQEKGLQGMEEYWGHIRKEENCVSESWIAGDIRFSHMKVCPSLSKVLDSDAEPCGKYCEHCPGWVGPLFAKCGFYFVDNIMGEREPECRSFATRNAAKAKQLLEEWKKQYPNGRFRTNFDLLEK